MTNMVSKGDITYCTSEYKSLKFKHNPQALLPYPYSN